MNPKVKRSPFEKFPTDLESKFRHSWSNNADKMSYMYTGTPALKTDFTRTGKRTYMGAINDGINSVTRYYINNFTDGYYCDCYDLLTQKITPDFKMKQRGMLSPIRYQMMFMFISLMIVKFILDSVIMPSPIEQPFLQNDTSGNDTASAAAEQVVDALTGATYSGKQQFFYYIVMFGTFAANLHSIMSNGRSFIDDSSRFQ